MRLLFLSLLIPASLCFSACVETTAPEDEAQIIAGRNQVAFPTVSENAKVLPGLELGMLDNGMRYAIYPYDFPENFVSIEMAVHAGSVDELDGTTGIAHFLEHMAFNGSENIKEDELEQILGEKGMSIGGNVNASTDFDVTRYIFNLPDSSDGMLDTAFFVLSEMADKLVFADDAIDRERGIIRSELRKRLGVWSDQNTAKTEFFYPGLLTTHRSPIGFTDDIDSVTREDFELFYETYYRPEHTVLTIVGPVDPEDIKERIEDSFASWKRNGDALPFPDFGTIDEDRAGEVGTFHDPDATPSIVLSWLKETESTDGRVALRDRLINTLAASIFEFRYSEFNTFLLSKDETAKTANLGYSYEEAGDNVFDELSIEIWPSDLETGLADGVKNLSHMRTYLLEKGVTEAYLEDLKEDFLSWQKEDRDLLRKWGSYDYSASISNDIIYGTTPQSREDVAVQLEREIASITVDDISDAFRRHFANDKAPLVFVSTKEEVEGIGETALAGWEAAQSESTDILKEFDAVNTVTTVSDVTPFAYDQFAKSAALKMQDYISDIGVTRMAFDNNVKLNVTTESFGSEKVEINIRFGRGKFEPDFVNAPGISDLIQTTFVNGGLKAHSSQDLFAIFPALEQIGTLTVEEDAFHFAAEVDAAYLEDQIKVMNAYFIEPGWDEDAFKDFKEIYVDSGSSEALSTLPDYIVRQEVERLACPMDVLCKTPTQQDYAALTHADAMKSMARALKQGHIEISIIGDVDIDKVQSVVGRTFGHLSERTKTPLDVSRDRAFGAGEKNPFVFKHKGSDERAIVSVVWPTPDGIDTKRARQIRMVRDIFYGKIFRSLREAEGLTYSPYVGGKISSVYEDYGYINVEADVKVEGVDRATALIIEIGEQMKRGDFSADDLVKTKTQFIGSAKAVNSNKQSMTALLYQLQGRPHLLDDHRNIVSHYQDTTLEEITTLARDIFVQENAKIIHVVPE